MYVYICINQSFVFIVLTLEHNTFKYILYILYNNLKNIIFSAIIVCYKFLSLRVKLYFKDNVNVNLLLKASLILNQKPLIFCKTLCYV